MKCSSKELISSHINCAVLDPGEPVQVLRGQTWGRVVAGIDGGRTCLKMEIVCWGIDEFRICRNVPRSSCLIAPRPSIS